MTGCTAVAALVVLVVWLLRSSAPINRTLTAAPFSAMPVGRRSWVTVPPYRAGDVDALREVPGGAPRGEGRHDAASVLGGSSARWWWSLPRISRRPRAAATTA